MRKLILLVLMLAVGSAASAAIITSVDRSGGYSGYRDPIGAYNGEDDPLPMEAGGLEDGNYIFSDRTYYWVNTPEDLIGSEYIRTFNSDKLVPDTITYTVTTSKAATLFVTVDDRFLTDMGLVLQGIADGIVADFAAPGTFADTGMNLTIRERDDGSQDRPVSVFAAEFDAGTYVFRGSPPRKNFGVYGAIPEPTTVVLLGMGSIALVRRRRK
jgi:hypothetical protein